MRRVEKTLRRISLLSHFDESGLWEFTEIKVCFLTDDPSNLTGGGVCVCVGGS